MIKGLISFTRRTTFSRFIVAGGLNTLFGYTVFSTLIYLKLNYIVALSCSTAMGIIFSFFNFGNYVFYSNNRKLIFRFILVYLFLYFFNLGMLSWLLPVVKNTYLTQALIIPLMATCSYKLNKDFVFRLSPEVENLDENSV